MKRALVALTTAAALGFAPAAEAHKPSKRAAKNEARIAAEDRTRVCRGHLGRGGSVRLIGGTRHTRLVEVITVDGHLNSLAFHVRVNHDPRVTSIRFVGTSGGGAC